MSKTASMIQECLEEMTSHILFDYNGKHCGVDPIRRERQYDMWYGEEVFSATSVDEVMSVKFFDGKSLNDISDEIEIEIN